MRVVKDATERKNEILDVAEYLFGTRGFDNTSTNDILKEVNIARGTLYYHFKSKEDILDGVIDRMVRTVISKAQMIARDKSISLVNRIPYTIMALNIENDVAKEIMIQIHKPQNALMHQKMQERLISSVTPIISSLILEGMELGIFDIKYPNEVAEMLLVYSNIAFDDLNQQSQEAKQQRIMGFIYNTERLLGAKEGSLLEPLLKIFS